MKYLFVFFSLFLASCYQPPPGSVQGDPEVLMSTIDTYEGYRGDVGQCPYLSQYYVLDAPLEEIQSACVSQSSSITGCMFTVQSPVGGSYIMVYRRDDLVGRPQISLVVHELLHAVRGCWVSNGTPEDYLERWRMGWSVPECRSTGAQDRRHCDEELFREIERDAVSRIYTE